MSTIKLKRSSVPGKVPSVSDLELGEVAINTADGKIYIKKNDNGVEYIVPFTENTAAEIIAKLLTVDGAGSGLDADLLDGQQGSYYLDWTNVTNKPDPNISVTLSGDVSGSANTTLTDLANGSISITTVVTDDSHNHIIANVDGLQTALDNKLPLTGKAADSDLLDGQDSTYYLDWTNVTNKPDPVVTVSLSGDVSGTGSATLTNLANGSISITATIADDSHNHIIANVDGLQSALDSKLNLSGGSVTGDVTLNNSADLVFRDKNGTFPTSAGSFFWDLNNDEARIYATQPGSDQIDFVFKISDNAGPTDRFVFWIDDYRGSTFDKYPAHFDGQAQYLSVPVDVNGAKDLANARLRVPFSGDVQIDGYRVWHMGNDGGGSGLDADTLDGQQGSYYRDWTNITNKPDPTITLAGDLTGSVTLTDLGSGTLTASVVDDSHNHVISNVDGLQTALDGKLSITGKAVDSDLLDGLNYTQFLRSDVNAVHQTSTSRIALSTDSGGSISLGRIDGVASAPYIDFNSGATTVDYDSRIMSTTGTGVTGQGNFTVFSGTFRHNSDQVFTDGYHPNADKLTTARTISLTGDVSGSVSFDGTSNVSITATVADDSHNHVISNVDGLQAALDSKVDLAGDTMTGFLTLHADPTQGLHAATKNYVDEVATGLQVKGSVEAATTTNLSGTYDNGTSGVGATLTLPAAATLSIDGWTSWSLYDGILVKDQTDPAENGRYYVSTVGDAGTNWVLTRCHVCDEPSEIIGAFIFVSHGNTYGSTGWTATVQNVDTFAVGVDAINWTQFSGAGTYLAGTDLTLDGTTFNLNSTIAANTTGNAATATALQTARTISLTGDVSGSVSFDGTSNVSITATVADDSHNHIIANVDGLQTALDGKLSTTGKAVDSDKLDNLDSTQFLRSDVDDQYTSGVLTFSAETTLLGNKFSTTSQPAKLGGFVINPASEGEGVLDPRFINDLAGANHWANGITLTNCFGSDRVTPATVLSASAFDATSSFAQIYQNVAGDPCVIELDISNNQLNYSCWIGIVFGASFFRAQDVKIETYRGGAWVTDLDITGQPDDMVSIRLGNSGAAGVQKIRYTLDGFVNPSGYTRIGTLFAMNYQAGNNPYGGVYFMEKYKDTSHYGNITPAANNAYTLGSTSLRYNGVYANTIDATTGTFSGDVSVLGENLSVGSGNTGEALIQLDASNAGYPAIYMSDNGNDMYWTIVGDDVDNNFKIHGDTTSQPSGLIANPYFEIENGTGTLRNNGNRVLTEADEGAGNGLDADTLDGQQGSYYLDWTNVTNKPDPTVSVTLTGDVSGSANTTLTNLANGSISITTVVADDSHNHIIANVDGLQAALDGKLSTTGKAADAELLDGLDSTQYLRSGVPDSATTIEFKGGTNYIPPAGAGSDTATDVGVALTSGTRLVGVADGYIRTLLEWNTGADIQVGQDGTSLITGIDLIPGINGQAKVRGNRILTVADEGTGNGLDADTVDGIQASQFLRSDVADTATANITFTDSKVRFDDTSFGSFDWEMFQNPNGKLSFTVVGTLGAEMELTSDGVNYQNAELAVGGYKVWTAGNDGAGSNLDADLLDGQQGSYYLDWTNVTNKPDPTVSVTLTGDVSGSGSATLTDLANGAISITATVADDSHNHIIANVDGLQSALDGKVAITGSSLTGPINFNVTEPAGVIKIAGKDAIKRLTTNGGMRVGVDDILILGAGEAGVSMEGNLNHLSEVVAIGGETGVRFYSFPNNDTTWSNRKEMSFDADGILSVPETLKVNYYTNIGSTTALISTTAETVVSSFDSTSFSSAKVLVQAKDTVTGEVHISEFLIAHDGTTATATEYGIVYTGAAPLASYEVDLSGGLVRIKATGASANATRYSSSLTMIAG